jgi:uncharacterized protein (DUF2252 family)
MSVGKQSSNEAKHLGGPTRFRMHPTHEEQVAMGKALRDTCSRKSHARWQPPGDRPDPLVMLTKSSEGRIPQLIPIRYGRMLQSPFAWYRGSAMSMAADLANTPTTGLRVQACGDAHLCNFGAYATPERRIIFDINDLDETLPAPWEWDVKRLAASFVLACRDNGFGEDDARDAALRCVRSYREHMAELCEMPVLDVWYADMDVERLITGVDAKTRKRAQRRLARARERTVLEHDFPELVHANGLAPTIKENPPLIYHWREESHEEHMARIRKAFEGYRNSLPEHFRLLLDRYKFMDYAIKVVGVGSVGTICAIMLLMASERDPLFLQVKQASASVLEPYAGKSAHANHGQRVVAGYKLMQAASDLFLGWTQGPYGHFYVRQLRDVKIKMLVEFFTPGVMLTYAEACGWCLARAHARSGEPSKIAGYLGNNDSFDEAVADFAIAYADQSERDHEVLTRAVRDGTLEVYIEDEE